MEHRFTPLIWLSVAWLTLVAGAEAQSVPRVSLTPIPAHPGTMALSGPQLLEQVVERISTYGTVSAKIRHRSQLFGQKLVGTGTYLQSRLDQRLQVRLSLSVKTADRVVSLRHVSDGRILWMYDNLEGRPRLSRVDLLRLQQAAAEYRAEPMPILLGGGLQQLLGSLQANFLPAAPQPLIFQDVPVWAIALRWNPAELARYWPETKPQGDQDGVLTERLPAHVPDRVLLLVGQDDLFPYHIDFRRSVADEVSSFGTPGGSTASRSLTTMELFEVQFNAPLDPMLFVYQSGSLEIDDRTDEYLSQMRQARRQTNTEGR
jgi:hypothetical protein